MRNRSMKRRASFLLLFLPLGLLGGSGGLGAQTPAEAADDAAGWSVGTSLTYPIVRIYPLHINRRIDAQREVFFGPAYQNWTSGTITAQSYTLVMGYRHYLWRELHVELELWPAWGRWHSSVTDRNYPGWELWAEPKIGYRFHLTRNLYLQPAPGVGFGIFRTNRPPRFDEDIESPIFVPQVILGVRF
ncbi:MAG: hypothetical protein EA421_07685 [Gemmatimonadales bacterium]|nr:MAG: hypothetical protein EA421_07685 [Gemmatimonadales bacterium]